MKELKRKSWGVRDYAVLVEVEARDVGKKFLFKTQHVPYGMGSGYVWSILIEQNEAKWAGWAPELVEAKMMDPSRGVEGDGA